MNRLSCQQGDIFPMYTITFVCEVDLRNAPYSCLSTIVKNFFSPGPNDSPL